MSEVTRILALVDDDPEAAKQLLPLVYEELRQLAAARLNHERPGQTLTATALVHEAYLRLVGDDDDQSWENRAHFFGAAAEAMRRVLLNRARDKKRLKRGGDRRRVDLSTISLALETPPDVLIDLDEAIEALSLQDPTAAQLIKLRFFAGLSLKDASASLGLTRRQGDRLWAFARAWLFDRLRES
ncbi:ECF-type sigma factor [Thalassoroseus pseudoceratinae]|uniref:ECF-type sigma factor n=1 Tax=Thalassoroseus pseudoceratinae TaxID=2713176 RepID=UPI00141FC79E|nr:ECF-type sigma factor [Thalassoroseus pseudoceratinae]